MREIYFFIIICSVGFFIKKRLILTRRGLIKGGFIYKSKLLFNSALNLISSPIQIKKRQGLKILKKNFFILFNT